VVSQQLLGADSGIAVPDAALRGQKTHAYSVHAPRPFLPKHGGARMHIVVENTGTAPSGNKLFRELRRRQRASPEGRENGLSGGVGSLSGGNHYERAAKPAGTGKRLIQRDFARMAGNKRGSPSYRKVRAGMGGKGLFPAHVDKGSEALLHGLGEASW